MAILEQDGKVYADYVAAKQAHLDDVHSIEKFDLFCACEDAYWAAEAKAKAKWDAIPECDAKDSAYINADDTQAEKMFSAGNRLAWYLCAISSFDFCS